MYVAILIVAFVLALIIRLNAGSNVLFYAYLARRSIFPGRVSYAFLYIIRIIITALMVYSSFFYGCRLRSQRKLIIISIISLFVVLFEYKLLFFYESFLITILMLSLIVFCNMCEIKKICISSIRYPNWAAYSFVLCIIQLYMIICILSIII